MLAAYGGGGGGGVPRNQGQRNRNRMKLNYGHTPPRYHKPKPKPKPKPTYHPPKQRYTPPPTYNPPPPPSGGGGGGGGSSYGGGGGGVGSGRGGNISRVATPAPPPPPPKPPSLSQFLKKDSTYTTQVADLKNALAQYIANQGQNRAEYQTNYAGDVRDIRKGRKEGLTGLEQDFAGRGLLNSGLYANQMQELNSSWDQHRSDLDKARAAYLAGLKSDLGNFREDQRVARQKAKSSAANRRAVKYGL